MSDVVKGCLSILACLAVVAAVGIGGCAGISGIKSWGRSQARDNAKNHVAITKINISNERAQAQVVAADNGVVRQQAYQRYLQAVGIRRAQDEIAKTLTPLYIQHEAIQAEEEIAQSGQNSTFVYIPSGAGGIPLVNTTPSPSAK